MSILYAILQKAKSRKKGISSSSRQSICKVNKH